MHLEKNYESYGQKFELDITILQDFKTTPYCLLILSKDLILTCNHLLI